MGKKRVAAGAMTPPADPTVVRLRIDHRGETDVVGSGEGLLLLYDPLIVTRGRLDRFVGLEQVVATVLGWVAGHPSPPVVAMPERWSSFHGRRESARRIAELVELALLRSLAALPLQVDGWGAEIRFQPGPLSADEARAHKRLLKSRGVVAEEPYSAWISATGPRLAVTTSFFIAFPAARKEQMFGPGYEVEFPWPAGDYHAQGWSFEDDLTEDEDGRAFPRRVVRLAALPAAGGLAEPSAAADRGGI